MSRMTAPPEPPVPVVNYAAPPAPARGPWLFYSFLAIVLWAVFGVASKAASNSLSGTDL
jgi:hypothetical protein